MDISQYANQKIMRTDMDLPEQPWSDEVASQIKNIAMEVAEANQALSALEDRMFGASSAGQAGSDVAKSLRSSRSGEINDLLQTLLDAARSTARRAQSLNGRI